MTTKEARQYLLAYRPELCDDPAWKDDPRLREALDLAEANPELRAWWDQHCEFDRTARQAFQDIPVPLDGLTRILEQARRGEQGKPPARGMELNWGWLVPAAAVLIGLALLLWPRPPASPELDFDTYRARMMRNVLREYAMSILTNDLSAIQVHLQEMKAPSTFEEPAGLSALTRTGAGVVGWRTNQVAMVCYDRGDQQMLFLFVAHRNDVPDAPGWPPSTVMDKGLQTVTWTTNDWVYLLAGPQGESLEKHAP